MSGFRVCSERCDECLFGPTPIVTSARRKQIIQDIHRKDCHFICHKFTLAGGQNACCRGDYDRNPARTNLMRIAGRLGVVEFVPLPASSHGTGRPPRDERMTP